MYVTYVTCDPTCFVTRLWRLGSGSVPQDHPRQPGKRTSLTTPSPGMRPPNTLWSRRCSQPSPSPADQGRWLSSFHLACHSVRHLGRMFDLGFPQPSLISGLFEQPFLPHLLPGQYIHKNSPLQHCCFSELSRPKHVILIKLLNTEINQNFELLDWILVSCDQW